MCSYFVPFPVFSTGRALIRSWCAKDLPYDSQSSTWLLISGSPIQCADNVCTRPSTPLHSIHIPLTMTPEEIGLLNQLGESLYQNLVNVICTCVVYGAFCLIWIIRPRRLHAVKFMLELNSSFNRPVHSLVLYSHAFVSVRTQFFILVRIKRPLTGARLPGRSQ